MNDKMRKYGAVVSVPSELLDRYPTYIPRIEEELGYKLIDPIIKEAIKGECIVRFTETRQRKDFTTDLIEFHKSVSVEEIVRCKDCKHFKQDIPCVGGTYNGCDQLEGRDGCEPYVEEDFFCAYGERETDEP